MLNAQTKLCYVSFSCRELRNNCCGLSNGHTCRPSRCNAGGTNAGTILQERSTFRNFVFYFGALSCSMIVMRPAKNILSRNLVQTFLLKKIQEKNDFGKKIVQIKCQCTMDYILSLDVIGTPWHFSWLPFRGTTGNIVSGLLFPHKRPPCNHSLLIILRIFEEEKKLHPPTTRHMAGGVRLLECLNQRLSSLMLIGEPNNLGICTSFRPCWPYEFQWWPTWLCT